MSEIVSLQQLVKLKQQLEQYFTVKANIQSPNQNLIVLYAIML